MNSYSSVWFAMALLMVASQCSARAGSSWPLEGALPRNDHLDLPLGPGLPTPIAADAGTSAWEDFARHQNQNRRQETNPSAPDSSQFGPSVMLLLDTLRGEWIDGTIDSNAPPLCAMPRTANLKVRTESLRDGTPRWSSQHSYYLHFS